MGRTTVSEDEAGGESGSSRARGTAEPTLVGVNGARSFPATVGPSRIVDIVGLCVLAVIALVLRFWTRSPMWLDEALTVNIARQPLGQIPGALRHDGHPPLYYVMLHGWMAVFGTSNQVIRALPGIFGVAAIPATWLMGRRVGGRTVAWCAAVVIALVPFAVRYSTENRMYSLLMFLVPVAWLCADSALRRPRALPLIGLVVCTSALLWSQYWALWLGVSAVIVVGWTMIRARRIGAPERVRAGWWVLGALTVGALSFVPWLPTMLYQQAHTGTPWATRSLPPTLIVTTLQGLGGPLNATNEIGGWIFGLLMMLGLFGVGVASGRIELDLRTRPWIRPLAWPAGLTILIGTAVMLVSNSAFQPRYNAIWLPFGFVIAGVGISVLRGPVIQRGALALVVVASAFGNYQNVTKARTQAVETAHAIERNGRPGDIVAVCPDQLGPSLDRVLAPGFDVGTYPTFGNPAIVDWADYVKRTDSVSPSEFADDLIERAGDDRTIFVVWSESYTTHRKLCTDLVTALTAQRPDNRQLLEADRSFFESSNLTEFRPGPPR